MRTLCSLVIVGVVCLAVAPGAGARPKATGICKAGERGDREVLDEPLDPGALSTCSPRELRLLRNAIFARHGYRFRDEALRAHFGRFEWYRPDPRATRRLRRGKGLSPTERENIQRIERAERGGGIPDRLAPPDLAGKRLVHQAASTVDVYHFCPGNRVVCEHRVSEIKDDREHGRWRWEGDRLVLHFTRATGGKPQGKPLHCAAVCEYASYEPFEKRIDRTEKIPRRRITESDTWRIEHKGAHCP